MAETRVTRLIRAPRLRVYDALVDPVAVQQWMVPDGMRSEIHRFDPAVGGTFRVSLTYDEPTGAGKTTAHTDTFHGRFTALVPGARVEQAVEFETDDPWLQGEMAITYTLTGGPEPGTTVVLSRHRNLPPGVPPADNTLGWELSLAKLAALLEPPPSKDAGSVRGSAGQTPAQGQVPVGRRLRSWLCARSGHQLGYQRLRRR